MHEPRTEDPALESDRSSFDEASDLEGFSVEESDEIAEEAARGRALDRRLAEDLEQGGATTRPVSGAYIRGLGQRGRLSPSMERNLVRAAVAGTGMRVPRS
jgi:hypothetical protein